jgi:hypothetical protein
MSFVIKRAIDIKSRDVVVFERMELKSPDVMVRENIIPLGVFGKRSSILFAM